MKSKDRSQAKSMLKLGMTCIISVLLTACASDGKYNNDSEIVLSAAIPAVSHDKFMQVVFLIHRWAWRRF